jgi:hypothetical protein
MEASAIDFSSLLCDADHTADVTFITPPVRDVNRVARPV